MPNKFFNDYFGFNKQQRSGLLILLFISFLLLIIRIVFPYFIKPDPVLIEELPLIEKKLDSAAQVKPWEKKESVTVEKAEKKDARLFEFDPNKVTYDQLIKLGFKSKTAKGLIKFRKKGFVFKTRPDLKKVYGVSERFYSKLEPYIVIGTKEIKGNEGTKEAREMKKTEGTKDNSGSKNESRKLDLNTCDSSALVQLKGIGPAYARRIVKYRDILGGFISVEQLKEVYGFNGEVYAALHHYFVVKDPVLRKIDLNKDDFKIINRHPYFTYEITKSIVKMRRRTRIDSPVLQGILGDEALYQKVRPYLVLD